MSALDYFKLRLEATLSPMDLRRLLAEEFDKVQLVDVRIGPAEMMREHIPGAVWIPQNEIEARMNELPKDKLLVLYCWETWCSLASRAAIVLLEAGFQVKELYGGIAAWNTMGLPIKQGTAAARCGC